MVFNRNNNFARAMLVLACGFMLWGASAAQAKNETKSPAKTAKIEDKAPAAAANTDWQIRCQDLSAAEGKAAGKYCEGVQSLFVVQTDKEGKNANPQRIAELAVGYPPGKNSKTAQAVVVLPLGIVVNEKIIVEVDGNAIDKIEIRFCDNGGCAALFELDKGALDKMRKGKEISFRTKSAANQPVLIGLPLSAFAKVHEQIAPKK